MANIFKRTGDWDLQTIGSWFIIPTILIVAFILPPLLFPLLLTFELLVIAEILGVFRTAAPQGFCTPSVISLKPRSPPVF